MKRTNLFFVLVFFSTALFAQSERDSTLTIKRMKGVKIVAAQKAVEKEVGKTTYNVSQNTTNIGGTLEDVLRKTPNIRVDQSGKISIQGKQNASIWVDGKPSPMAEADPSSFMKSIQSSSIENIEVITNPGAKYDAQGSGGIIHIKLKKEKRKGSNGNINAGYGFTNRCNTNIALNKKADDWNSFVSYGYQRTYAQHLYVEDKSIQLPDTAYQYNMYNTGNSASESHNFKTGLDHFFDRGSISYTFNTLASNSTETSSASGKWFVKTDTLATILSNPFQKSKNNSYSNDISIRKTLDTLGKEISASIIYSYVPSQSNPIFNASLFDQMGNEVSTGKIDQKTNTLNTIQNIISQIDYTTHAKFASKIEMGLKNESTWNKNNFDLKDNINGIYTTNTLYSNQFNYFENIAAAYFSMENNINEKTKSSLGLRVENTNISSNNAAVTRQYINFFPNLKITRNLSEMRTIGAAISSRIQRPSFSQLNNSVTYNDPYSTWQGNPKLRPSIEYIFTFNFTDIQKKWMTSLDLNGSTMKDKFSEGTILDSMGISRSGFFNGSHYYYGSAALYNKFEFTNWLDIQLSNTYTLQYYEKLVGINNSAQLGHNYNLWSNINIKMGKIGGLELNGWYESGGIFTQGKSLPVGSLDIAYKISWLNNKLSFTANFVNVFNSMKFRWNVDNGGLLVNGQWQVINRALFLSFQYRFGGKEKYDRKEHEINQRLYGGGRN